MYTSAWPLVEWKLHFVFKNGSPPPRNPAIQLAESTNRINTHSETEGEGEKKINPTQEPLRETGAS